MDEKELDGLPDEVLNEIRSWGKKKSAAQLTFELISLCDSPLSCDEVIVGLYRKHGILIKRPSCSANLSRLVITGRIERLADKTYIVKKHEAKNIELEDL
jgi:hypothetical protein